MTNAGCGLVFLVLATLLLHEYFTTGCMHVGEFGEVCDYAADWGALCMGCFAVGGVYLLGKSRRDSNKQRKAGKDNGH
jgi:hypothetical protein